MQFLMVIFFMLNTAFASEFHSIKEKSIKGNELLMSGFKNKTVLIVNIASQCGFTGQLNDLEKLYKKYQGRQFVVLGVPTNDFGGQTPEDDKSMLEFCQKNYNVTFPILSKGTIKGKEMRDLYKFLTQKSSKEFQGEVGWNFVKFLVNKDGIVVGRFSSYVSPDDSDLIKKIESHL
jgi:glutathione peroxidase